MTTQQPQRRYQLTFTIGADDYQSMLSAMQNWLWFMEREHPDLAQNHNGVSGGYDSGYSYDLKVDPEMTHDRYFELVNIWLDDRDKTAPTDIATIKAGGDE